MQSPLSGGVFRAVPRDMPLPILMTKYQRFVAWRYLMERERRLSSSVLSFIGVCLWLATGMGAACLWYPLADPFLVPPPNPPIWLIAIVGLACAFPLVALLSVLVNTLRGIDVKGPLLLALHGVCIALAAFGVFEKSMGPGLTGLDSAATAVLFALLVVGVPVQAKFIAALLEGRQPTGLTAVISYLVTPVGFAFWAVLRIPRLRVRSNVFAFLLGLQLVAAELVLVYSAYRGLRSSVWSSLVPATGAVPGWSKLAAFCLILGVGFAIAWCASLFKKAPLRWALRFSLAGAAVAGFICVGFYFVLGVGEVGANLEFIGGWGAYTPPMGMVMPALVAAAIAILASVLLAARYAFTFFTTVSIGGVTIGTMALVIVLSVMSGFETDLREKILGFNAHLQISSADELQFEGYRDVQAVLERTAGVEGYTPFLTTEAYMSNHNNYGNVTLKGVDPARVASVTEIVHNLEKGDERALEKLWPLDEDGSILGKPLEAGSDDDFDLDDGPMDFSGGLEEIEEDDFDDFDLDEGPEDLSGGLDELPDAGPTDGLITAPPSKPDWDVDLRPHDYIDPSIAVLDGVLVGRELVKTVNLYTDQEVRVISPLPDTSPDGLSIPRLKNFRVAGRFFSGMYEYDLKYVYCSLRALQDFLDLGDVVNGIEVRVDDPRNTAAIVRSLEQSLGEGYKVQDWKELNRALFSALKLEKIAMFFILVIIVLVASFSIVGNLIMVVIEKAKEIAILKTLGSSDGGVMKIFITQGFFIGLVGTTLGVALGLGACYLGITFGVPLDPDVYYIDKLPIQVEGGSVVAVALAGLVISVVATIYPAFIAARMRPVKGLRWD